MRVETKPFAAAINEAAKIISAKSTVPILTCVEIAAGNGAASIFATDLDVELARTIPAGERLEPIAINCRELASILKGAAKGSVLTFEILESPAAYDAGEFDDGIEIKPAVKSAPGRVAITSDCGGVDVRLVCHAGGDLPKMKAKAETGSAMLAGVDFRNGLAAVEIAISTESTRYYLGGVSLHTRNYRGAKRLCMATTDGHRLAFKALPGVDPEALDCPDALLPRLTVGVLQRNLPADAVRMVWHAGDKREDAAPDHVPGPVRFTFYAEGVTVTTKLIDGTFPDYQRVIPSGNSKRATFNRAELLKACKDAARALGGPKAGGRALKLTLEDGETIVTATHRETGAAFRRKVRSKLPFESFDIGFNADYLADHCETVDGDDIELVFEDAGSPVLVRDPTDGDWLGVLMPMRV